MSGTAGHGHMPISWLTHYKPLLAEAVSWLLVPVHHVSFTFSLLSISAHLTESQLATLSPQIPFVAPRECW